MRAAEEGSATDVVVRPFLLVAGSALLLPLLVAAVAPASVVNPLVLAAAVVPFVLGFAWRPKGALLAFAIYMLFGDTIANYLPDGVTSVDEISAGCFLVIALLRSRGSFRARVSPVRDVAVGAFFAAAILSSIVHAVPLRIAGVELVLVVKAIAFLYVVLWLDHRPEDIRAYGRVLAVVTVAVLAFAAVEFLYPGIVAAVGLPRNQPSREGLPSLKGPFVQPYHFGWFVTFVLSLAFGRFAVVRGWQPFAIGMASLLALIMSARRWSLLAAGVAIAVGGLLSWQGLRSFRAAVRAWALPAAGSLVLVLVFLPSMLGLLRLAFTEYVDPAVAAGTGNPDTESMLPRISLYVGSLKIARDEFPLGVGLGRFASWESSVEYSPVYAKYGIDTQRGLTPAFHPYVVDTFWPQILGEAGVLGFIAYVVFLAALGVTLVRFAIREMRRHDRDPMVAAFALGAAVVFIECVVQSIANTMFHHPPEAFLTFGVVGVAVSLARQRAVAAAHAEQPVAPSALATAPGELPVADGLTASAAR